jgi:enoyl-CoA hydratase
VGKEPQPKAVKSLDLPNITVEHEHHIATATIHTTKKLNVITPEALRDYKRAVDHVEALRDAKVLILSAAGPHFTAGANIEEMVRMGSGEARRFSELGQSVFAAIEDLPVPVIVAIQGYCMGGGMEMIQACDIRVAAENSVFGQPEINIGVLPGWGGSQRLPRLIGLSKAKELIYTGRKVDAKEAEGIGLVDLVVPEKMLLPAVRGIAENIAEKPKVALATAKCAINALAELPQTEGLRVEQRLWADLFRTRDKEEGMRAFLEKRKPKFEDSLDEFSAIKAYIKSVSQGSGQNRETIFDVAHSVRERYRNAFEDWARAMTGVQETVADSAMKSFMEQQLAKVPGTSKVEKVAGIAGGGAPPARSSTSVASEGGTSPRRPKRPVKRRNR